MQTTDYVHLVLERADSDLCARSSPHPSPSPAARAPVPTRASLVLSRPTLRAHARARDLALAPLPSPPRYDWYEGPLPEVEALHVTKQLARAIAHCHAHNVAHRDLKPENVLIAGSHRLKSRVMLCDFGLCAMYTPEQRGLTDFVGSPGFYAPELLSDEPYDGEKVDVWSLGAVLLEMLLGHSQFDQMWLGVYKKEAKDLGDGTVLRRKLAHVLNELDPILFEHTGRSSGLRDLLVLGLLEVPRTRALSERSRARRVLTRARARFATGAAAKPPAIRSRPALGMVARRRVHPRSPQSPLREEGGADRGGRRRGARRV